MRDFEIKGNNFYLDNSEFKLISGAMHYFRIPADYWRDRLEKLQLMGCNTVETYIPWNLHEPKQGTFDFNGMLDLEKFLDLAQELGLYVIARPTPYICGEFEFGGIPWWLLKDRNMKVRSSYKGFMDAINSYYDILIPKLVERQINSGGSIIAIQIENEYGYYSQKKDYPILLKGALLNRGITVPLFTSDGPWGNHFEDGRIPGILQTGNFGSGAKTHFKKMRELQPNSPLVCMEFWMGWFDAWGDEHHTRDAEDAANSLDEILQEGHVNFYMAHGGTNFGFTAGANYYEEYKPDVTSYDYDSPISECGELTKKFYAFKDVISKYTEIPDITLSTDIARMDSFEVVKHSSTKLFSILNDISSVEEHSHTLSMEELDQGYGYTVYQFDLKESDKETDLDLSYCADRAIVFVDKKRVGCIDVNSKNKVLRLDLEGTQTIDVLVENQGRANFGPKMNFQRKGFFGPILVNHCEISPIKHYSLPFSNDFSYCEKVENLDGDAGLHKFQFSLDLEDGKYKDTFLDMSSWGKGIVFVNGFNIGRFWEIGPQYTLYIPGPLLKSGDNEIIIFETEGKYQNSLKFIDRPILS